MVCARCGNKSDVMIDAAIPGSDLKQNLWVCRDCVREGEKYTETGYYKDYVCVMCKRCIVTEKENICGNCK